VLTAHFLSYSFLYNKIIKEGRKKREDNSLIFYLSFFLSLSSGKKKREKIFCHFNQKIEETKILIFSKKKKRKRSFKQNIGPWMV